MLTNAHQGVKLSDKAGAAPSQETLLSRFVECITQESQNLLQFHKRLACPLPTHDTWWFSGTYM